MKPEIKNKLVDLLACPACSHLGKMLFGYGVPIFMLHRMQNSTSSNQSKSNTSDEYLRQCLRYLTDNNYTFLSLQDLIIALSKKQTLPKKSVVFTMDDGFEDQVKIAAPIFLEFNCPVTVFLITGMLDNKLWPWDDQVAYLLKNTSEPALDITIGEENYHFELDSTQNRNKARRILRDAIKSVSFSELNNILERLESATKTRIPKTPPPEYIPMTWDLAREYEKRGIEFAPHSISHPILSKLDNETMKQEMLGSWRRVKEELVSPKPIFCYPTGRYSDFGWREVKVLQESGFIGAVSTIPAQVRTQLVNNYYLYGLPRYALPNTFHDFKMYCSWIEYAKERNLRFWPQ
jgi:peptidoglycan/xylan/chitin deacetylase (PgdA/CDA1 family)